VTETLVLATRNEGKIRELAAILADSTVTLAGLGEFPGAPDVPETGATFEENALIKARAIAAYTGLPAVADDSGLCVDALNEMPGVLSARWAGRHGDDKANLDLVLAQISDVPDSRRGAHFACAAALVVPIAPEGPSEHQPAQSGGSERQRAAERSEALSPRPGGSGGMASPQAGGHRGVGPRGRYIEHVVTGRMTGRLIREPRGSGGFGYDPIFVPEGYDVTTAEMSADEKNAISHRGKAFRAIAPLIRHI
jgi:XTP/dITP diphosphohydrolase